MRLGVIGGSGLYQMAAVEDAEVVDIDTPWGKPSDSLILGRIGETPVAFLPRHGRGHRLAPSELNYRANIAALKLVGCTDVLSMSACGSFREELPPGTFVLVDQYVDRTRNRVRSFFGEGVVAHVSLADPACGSLAGIAEGALRALDLRYQRGGAYLVMEGPQFSTRAESLLYRAGGLDVIGMTAMPEAALAREAELCYQTVAMVTDFDAWHGDHEAVDVAQVLEVIHRNVENARALVVEVAKRLAQPAACTSGCRNALDHAIITDRGAWPPQTVERLKTIAGRVLA